VGGQQPRDHPVAQDAPLGVAPDRVEGDAGERTAVRRRVGLHGHQRDGVPREVHHGVVDVPAEGDRDLADVDDAHRPRLLSRPFELSSPIARRARSRRPAGRGRERALRRYEEVAEELVRQIRSGRWPIGGKFAPEVELAAEFEVSRGTIRAALDIVEELGLISRRPRRGTRVERLKPQSVFARHLHTLDDLMQYSVETDRRVLSIADVVVDEADAGNLGCRPGQRWTKIRMLRVDPADYGWPLGCADVYLEPDVAEAVGDQVLDPKRLISDMVEQATGRTVHTIEQRVRAATVPDAMVDLLRTAPGSPVLRVTRRYLDRGGQPFEITVSVHPA